MARVSTVQTNSLHKVLHVAEASGLDPDELLREVGLERRALSEPDGRVPFQKLVALYELAAERANDEAFGLRVGAASDPTMFDVLGHAALACPTLGASIETVTRYCRVLREGASFGVVAEGRVARLSYAIHDARVGPWRQEAEATLAIALRFVQGTAFSTLVGEVRRELATTLLGDRRMSVADVAFLLGYAELGTFDRAFKRWMKATPRAWRARRP